MPASRDRLRPFFIRKPQIVKIISFHRRRFSKPMPDIKPFRADVVLMHSESDRAHARFGIDLFDRLFQHITADPAVSVPLINNKAHEAIKGTALHFFRIRIPFEGFSEQDHTDAFICPFDRICVPFAMMVDPILVELYDRVSGIDECFSDVVALYPADPFHVGIGKDLQSDQVHGLLLI